MIIIGITGTLGAGKGTIVDYLVKEKASCTTRCGPISQKNANAAGLR